MSKGENIYKRKDGRWEARYVKGRLPSGKIQYGYCYGKSYKEAKTKANERKASILYDPNSAFAAPVKNFETYCNEWLQSKKFNLKESTFIKYETILRRHIKPKLGQYTPQTLKSTQIDRFIDELISEKDMSPKSTKDILIILRSILKYVTKQNPKHPVNIEFSYPKCAKKQMRVLSQEEQTDFVNYLLEDINPCTFGILLSMSTGLRIGEICALKWTCISLEDGTLHVNQTMQRLHQDGDLKSRTKIIITSPKSETSKRLIPLPDYIYTLCKQVMPENQDTYVLTGTTKYMEPRTLQYRLKKYAENCNIENMHFHALRHTFATRCVEVGFEIKSLSEILGHATTTLTLDRYVHSSMDLKRSNMKKLEVIGFNQSLQMS